MRTLINLLTHAASELFCLLLSCADGTYALRAEVARLQRSLAAETRRADNLLAQNRECFATLADATMVMEQAIASTSRHIAEHFAMEVKVEYLTQRNSYLEACYKQAQAVNAYSAMHLPQTYQAGIWVVREGVTPP